VTQHSINTTFN